MTASTVIPALNRSSLLNYLSGFADVHVYGCPTLRTGTEDLCERAGQDLTYLFTLIRDRNDFDRRRSNPLTSLFELPATGQRSLGCPVAVVSRSTTYTP